MKLIKSIVFFWLFTIGLFSCSTPIDVMGTYISTFRGNPHRLDIHTVHKLVINADSTFNYFYIVMGDPEKYSSGTWKQIDKDIIILNSDIQSNTIPLNVEIIPSNKKNSMINLKLIVPGEDEKEYRVTPFALIDNNWYMDSFLPDRGSHSYKVTNYYSNEHDLFFKISKEPRTFERIGPRPFKEYYVLETEHKKTTLNDGDIVNVTINVPDSLFLYRIFNSEKIKVDGKKMIFKDKEVNNKTNKLYLK